jgi:hypothetical protein
MNNRILFKAISRALVLLILSGTLLTSCKDVNSVMVESTTDYAIRISYEQERYTEQYMPGVAFEQQSPALQVAAPVNERTHVDIKIFADGTSEWTLTNQTPKFPFEVKKECLPDITPKVVKTVIKGNMAYYFDAKNNLINSGEMQVPDFTEFIEIIKANGNQLTKEIFSRYFNEDYLKSATNDKRLKLSSGLTRIEHIFTQEDGVSEDLIGKTGLTFIDTKTGVRRGIAVVDVDKHYIYRKSFNYDKDESNIIPESEKSESFNKDTEGNDYVVNTTIINENVVIENNL